MIDLAPPPPLGTLLSLPQIPGPPAGWAAWSYELWRVPEDSCGPEEKQNPEIRQTETPPKQNESQLL